MAGVNAMARPSAREYETIYVLRPDIDPETANRVSTRVSDVLTRERGKLARVETWGRRKLAYPVRKYRRGIYVFLRYIGENTLVAELERNLRMQKDAVLKFMTIKVSDEVPDETIDVKPEDIQFTAVEPMTAEEMDESREKLLGLVDSHDRHSREDRNRVDRMDDTSDDGDDTDDLDDEER